MRHRSMLQVATDNSPYHGDQFRPRGATQVMSALDELSQSLTSDRRLGHAVDRRHRVPPARLRCRRRRWPGPHQCPQRSRRRGHRDVRRRPIDGRSPRRDRRRRGPRGHRRRHRRREGHRVGRRRRTLRRGDRLCRRCDARRRRSGDVRVDQRRRAVVPRPGRPEDRGQPRAHRAARAGFVRRPAPRRRGAAARAQHQPAR